MLDDCRDLCTRMGLRIVGEHIDDGLSGAVRNRPGFVKWLADATEMRADHLIAWHVDRMTREGVNVAGMILDAIEGKDPETGEVVRQPVRLLDTQGLDSGSGDDTAFRFNFVIKAEVARAERERMKDRNKNARRRALTAGRWPGGPAPFGYRVGENPDGPGKVLLIDSVEAAFIRDTAERVLAGENATTVARWANMPGGVLPRRAPRWTRRTIIQVLTGYPVQGRSMKIIEGRHVPVLGEDGHPVTFEGILSDDECAALRQKLAVKNPDARKGGRNPSRLLSGLLTCHYCGTRLQVSPNRGTTIYRCQEAYNGSASCRRPPAISANAVDAYMTRHFLDRWGDSPEMVRRAEVAGAALVEAAEEEHAAALEALAKSATAEAFTRLQRAQVRRDEVLALPHETIVRVVPTGRTIREAWDAGDVLSRRDLLVMNYSEIIVGPGKRGGRVLDPSRLTIVAQPPYVVGASPEEGFRIGTVTVAPEDPSSWDAITVEDVV